VTKRPPRDDAETRERLLTAAATLFGARGFAGVTVRDICKAARANVAAVNYHFGDKSGLYDEVVRTAIRGMQVTTDDMRKAGEGRPPAEQLEASIRIFLTRVATTRAKWVQQLMLQEVSNPTARFELIMKDVLKPRLDYVRCAIAGIIGCEVDDPRVGLCVMSVQAQLLAVVGDSPLARRLGNEPLTAERAADLAAHIARFSIAGVNAIGRDVTKR
jgi:TetR/AcrR family transcriptional regulator, regulator of cefoperazone and chloramphenicol sensitivity